MAYFVECFRYIKKNASSNPSSKHLELSRVIAISWLMQGSPGLKRDWLEEIRLFIVFHALMTNVLFTDQKINL